MASRAGLRATIATAQGNRKLQCCPTTANRPETGRSAARNNSARAPQRGRQATPKIARSDVSLETDDQVAQFLAPEPDVSPPLSPAEQEELEKLLNENAKLRQKLELHMDRLKPGQVEKLMNVYQEIVETTSKPASKPAATTSPSASVGSVPSVSSISEPTTPATQVMPSVEKAAEAIPDDVEQALAKLAADYMDVTSTPAVKPDVAAPSAKNSADIVPQVDSFEQQTIITKEGDKVEIAVQKKSGVITYDFGTVLNKLVTGPAKGEGAEVTSAEEFDQGLPWPYRPSVVAASYVDQKESSKGPIDSAGYANEMATLSVELDEVVGESVDSASYAKDMASLSVELDEDTNDDSDNIGHDTDNSLTTPTAEDPVASTKPRTDREGSPRGSPRASMDISSTTETAPKAVEADAKAAIRAAANAEVTLHEPAAFLAEKSHWLVATVPEKPVAGADCVVYFNRMQSDALRHRPHVIMQLGFNQWELQTEQAKLDLTAAPVPRSESTDFWWCRFKVPEETFEINFVLTDGQGAYDNNAGQDFTYFVEAGITLDDWIDLAAERALAMRAAQMEAEAKAAVEAEKQRQAAAQQGDAERARRRAFGLRDDYGRLREGAATRQSGRDGLPLWEVVPEAPHATDKVTLRYNRAASVLHWIDLKEEHALTLKFGFNSWQKPGEVAMVRAKGDAAEGGDWWEAEVEVPFDAVVMNYVVNVFEHYDNNERRDFKVLIDLPVGMDMDRWVEQLLEMFREQEYSTRVLAEAADKERQERRLREKKTAQEMVKAVERRKVRHVLFTEPEVVTAGEEVTVYYNPNNTNLPGREQIYMIGGWNRWRHRRPFGPLPMTPPTEGLHWKATVKVPKDAYKMDFVFSDVAGGEGTYDNRGGLDYHLPVEGSAASEPGLYVMHISVEMAPIAKVGGLGDVVTALGRAVKEQGHLVEVCLPKYQFFNASPVLHNNMLYETEFDWGGTRIYVTSAIVENVRVWLIEPRNGFFDTQSVYGRYDDEVRFDFFCKAALEFLLRTNRQPDILHCHDWATAHVAKSYWADYHSYGLWKPKVVFTIHNMNYGQKKIAEAAYNCQKFTTVSPTYAYEVGGSAIIAPQVHKFMGIRNGIDPDLWSPDNNQWLPVTYTSENVVEGKRAARLALRQRVGLTDWGDKFIVGVVTRLTSQKGTHLIKHTAFRTLDRGGQFVLLGSAPDPKVQAEFNALAASMGGQGAAFCFKYDEPLSHLIYAACDMIVVPSMFEPCGLTQMIAMRYGAVPVVRHTGGLKDTVFDVDFDKARAAWEVYGSSDWQRDSLDATNGFAFEGTDPGALDYALNRAIDAWYNDRAWFNGLQKRVMEQDWTWNRPAIDYIELYYAACKQ